MKKGILLITIALLVVFCGCGRNEVFPFESSSVVPEIETETESTTEETTTEETTTIPENVTIGDIVIPWDAEEADISYVDVKWMGIDMNNVLDSLPNLKKIYMIGCGYNNEEYAALQDAHPDIKIVWEIVLSYWTIRTDAVAFSTFKTCDDRFFLYNDEAYYLKYCTDLVALDLGHNFVSDISFLQYMPNLKILILVDNVKQVREDGYIEYLSDLSMLKNCPKLRYLEIFAIHAQDLSFLEVCKDIEDLNISYTSVNSIEYLTDLPHLQRLWMENCGISYDDYIRLTEIYPEARIVYYGTGSIDQGWRDGDHYWAMRDMFFNNYVNPIYED